MATSLIYAKAIHAAVKGDLDFDTGTFKCMLVNSTYQAVGDETKRDVHDFIDDVTGASGQITGTNYTAGGDTVTVTVETYDDTNNRINITLGEAQWTSATLTARGAVYYKDTGTPSTSTLIAYIDFGGGDVTVTNGTFTLSASTLRNQL